MTKYNTPEQQKLIDDTREEINERMRKRIEREKKEGNYGLLYDKKNT